MVTTRMKVDLCLEMEWETGFHKGDHSKVTLWANYVATHDELTYDEYPDELRKIAESFVRIAFSKRSKSDEAIKGAKHLVVDYHRLETKIMARFNSQKI